MTAKHEIEIPHPLPQNKKTHTHTHTRARARASNSQHHAILLHVNHMCGSQTLYGDCATLTDP